MKENEFNTVQGNMNESIIGAGHEIGFRANMRYQYHEVSAQELGPLAITHSDRKPSHKLLELP